MGELPHLRALVERFKDEPFAIVGVNTDFDADNFREKSREHGVTWINAWKGHELCERFGVNSFPTIAVLDADGRVQALNVRGDAMEKAVAKLLEELRRERGSEGSGSDGTR